MAKAKKLSSGKWRCLVYSYSDKDEFGEQKRHYKSFTAETKKEAEYMAAAFALNKKYEEERGLTFGEAWDRYIEKRSAILAPSTIREYLRSRKTDLQELVDLPIDNITQEQIQTVINSASKKLAPKTVRNIHGSLAAVFNIYRPDFRLSTKLPQKVRPKLVVPTDKEILAVLNAATDTSMEIPILLAAYGPMRRSEICGLRYEDISENNVHVAWAIVKDKNKQWVEKATKTYAGDRFIEFPKFVMDKLRGKRSKERIVSLTPSQVSDRFSDLVKAHCRRHFRLHDLRHYCASTLHAQGMKDAYIMARGGWGSDEVLKNVYRHVLEDNEKEMNEKVNDYFSNMQHKMQHENKKSL